MHGIFYSRPKVLRVKMFKPHFLIISLGNPLPKYASLHSAGHFALNGLARVLTLPDFGEVTLRKQTCLMSRGSKYTLVQSPTLMNISGGFVVRMWNHMIQQHDPASLSLVIVHDELEKDLGVVRLTAWDRSHKGHNGLKSVNGSLSQKNYPQSPFVRMSLGIGRPVERDPQTVSRYVLDRISQDQRKVLEEDVPWKIAEQLIKLEDEWRTERQP